MPQASATRSLFTGLDRLSRRPPSAKLYRPTLRQPFVANNPIFTDWSVDRAVREGYKANVWVYRCVSMTAEAGSSVPFGVQRRGPDGKWAWDWKHELSQVLADWNDDFSEQESMARGICHLLLGGNMLAGKFPGGQRVRELRLESPVDVEPVPNDIGGLSKYLYTDASGKRGEWLAEDLVHARLVDPNNPFWGLGRLRAIATEVDIDSEAAALNLGRLQRGGTPDGIITDKSVTTAAKRREMQAEIDRSWRDAKGPFLQGEGVDWIQLGLSQRDLQYLEGRTFSMKAIVLGFGYHPALFGHDSTYANSEQAAKLKWTDAVLPLLNVIASAFTRGLIPRERRLAGERIFYDTSGVEALQADIKSQVESYAQLVAHGVPPNTAIAITRLAIGDLPQGVGDVSFFDGRLVTAQSLMEPAEEPEEIEEEEEPEPEEEGAEA